MRVNGLKGCWSLLLLLASAVALLPLGPTLYNTPSAEASPEVFVGPEACRTCHAPIYERWVNGSHANALSDPVFQRVWEARGSPGECLECHTTGYDRATKSFAFDGVICESCHGAGMHQVPGGAAVSLNASSCGRCHSGPERPFLDEWKMSKHAESLQMFIRMGADRPECLRCHAAETALASWGVRPLEEAQNPISCPVCHDPHETGMRVEPTDELCARCHVGQHELWSEDSPHGLLGIDCATCHRYATPVDEMEVGLPGHEAIRGHTFRILKDEQERPLVCANCHGVIEGILSYDGAVAAMFRIQERISRAARDARIIADTAKEAIRLANATEGVNKRILADASTIWSQAEHVLSEDVERAYSKGFHNPVGMTMLIEEVIRNVTKAQSMALGARVTALTNTLNTTAGQLSVVTQGLDNAKNSISTLEGSLASVQRSLMETVGQVSALSYINAALLAGVVILIIVTALRRRRPDGGET